MKSKLLTIFLYSLKLTVREVLVEFHVFIMNCSEKSNQAFTDQAINFSALQLLKSYNILIPSHHNIGKIVFF